MGALDITLGDGAGQDDEVENVIWVSFIENAQGVSGDPDERLRDALRRFPNLARALSQYQ